MRSENAVNRKKSLTEQVAEWHQKTQEELQQILEGLYKSVVATRIAVPLEALKRELEKLELDILADLEPRSRRKRALFYRALCEARRGRGRPRLDEQARRVQELRKKQSWGQISKTNHKEADRLRKLLYRYELRKGQKPN
jgi:hypothetical protein